MFRHKLFLFCKLVKNVSSLVDNNQEQDVFSVSQTPENPENELNRVEEQLAQVADEIDLPTTLLKVSTFRESLYHYYGGELLRRGSFQWRVNDENKKVVLMNDYNCTTGEFLVSAHINKNGLIFHCPIPDVMLDISHLKIIQSPRAFSI